MYHHPPEATLILKRDTGSYYFQYRSRRTITCPAIYITKTNEPKFSGIIYPIANLDLPARFWQKLFIRFFFPDLVYFSSSISAGEQMKKLFMVLIASLCMCATVHAAGLENESQVEDAVEASMKSLQIYGSLVFNLFCLGSEYRCFV